MAEVERKVTMIGKCSRKKEDGVTRKKCFVTRNLCPPKTNCCRHGRVSCAVKTVANFISLFTVCSAFFFLYSRNCLLCITLTNRVRGP